MKNDLLPLGSVVVLNDGVKKVMIVGYLPVGDDDKVFDYCGCVFPEGIMENCYCLFDEENIRKVYFEGCKNKETEIYLGKINSILNKRDTANILSNSPNRKSSAEKVHGRIPKPAKHPISVDEMFGKYGVETKCTPEELGRLD